MNKDIINAEATLQAQKQKYEGTSDFANYESEITKGIKTMQNEAMALKVLYDDASEAEKKAKNKNKKTTSFELPDEKAEKEDEKLAKKQAEERKKLLLDINAKIDIETAAYNQRLKDAEIYGVKLEKMTKEQRDKQLELETEYQNNLREIALEYENKNFEKQKKDLGVDGDKTKLTEEQNKVLELLQARHEANLQKIKDDSAKKLIDIQKTIDATVLKSVKDVNKTALDAIDAKQQTALLAASSEAKNVEDLEKRKKKIESDALAERLVAQQNYVNALKVLNPTDEQAKELAAAQVKLDEIQTQTNEQKHTKEKDFQDKVKQVREQYELVSFSENFANEMEILQKQYEQKLLSEEEFQMAKLQIGLKYAQQYAQQTEQFIGAAANAVSAIEEAQTAKVGAEYEKRQAKLTNQLNEGIISQDEYNEEKKKLDYEQKSEELEIEKKFADANFAMQTAQIIASTAQGIITAWATAMQLGPIAGPIAAAALTALLGITAGAQIAKAKAERDRVKAMTLEAPASSTQGTAQIQLREGYADGGFTGEGEKYEVRGTASDGLPIHASEYVIPQEELKNPALVPMIRAIEGVRLKRTKSNPLPNSYGAGYADGGFASDNSSQLSVQQNDVNVFIINELRKIFNQKLQAEVNYFEFKDAETNLENINKFTKKR
ncbi:MAG: hypothetical protein LBN95_11990 [Prevotellaceae bacterium]|jgi:hypothetical protein|nr:hypothetical protein [Prevotellaceae bacterium]